MNEDSIYEAVSTNLKTLLTFLGPVVPDSMIERLGDDAATIQKDWKEFCTDILEGGRKGFAKHYELKTTGNNFKDGENEVTVGGLTARNKLAAIVMMTVCSSPLIQTGGFMMVRPHKEEHEYVELTPEKCRDIEFNI
jgi:hypothetical protein